MIYDKKRASLKDKSSNIISRRKFFRYLLGGLLSIEALWFLLRSTGQGNNTQKGKTLYDAGAITTFSNNQIYPFTSKQFNLIRYNDGGFLALSNKCTHLGCIISINPDKNGFTCPCHSSTFNRYGDVISSPATRSLDTYPIIFKDGHVWVDISQPMKRLKFEETQLFYTN